MHRYLRTVFVTVTSVVLSARQVGRNEAKRVREETFHEHKYELIKKSHYLKAQK